MLAFDQFTCQLSFVTNPPRLSLYYILTYHFWYLALAHEWLPHHRLNVFFTNAIRLAKSVWHIVHTYCVGITTQDRLIRPILYCYHICPMLQPQYSYKYGFPLDCIFDDTAQKVSYYYNTLHFIALLLYPNDVKLANI
jgi:hypothetical protein